MKYVLLTIIFLVSACTSMMNFQEQPVIKLADNLYKTTCDGVAEAMDSCNRKANKMCTNGYVIVEKIQLNDFVHRELTFKCK